MARQSSFDPYAAFNFRVTIDGIKVKGEDIKVRGGFSEVSGLEAEMEVLEYREGGRNDYPRKLWGPTKYSSNLVLKRGMINMLLLGWLREVTDTGLKDVPRATVTIQLLDAKTAPVMSWEFVEAFPVKWSGPNLQAASNTLALETLELAHHGLKKKK